MQKQPVVDRVLRVAKHPSHAKYQRMQFNGQAVDKIPETGRIKINGDP